MHECILSDEICYYISSEDYDRLISTPGLSEDDIDFKEVPGLKKVLSEFGL